MSLLFFSFFISSLLLISIDAQNQGPSLISSFSTQNQPWRPNSNITLLSKNSTFAAGFLLVDKNSRRNLYIFSIWYHNITTKDVVWSANPYSPVNQSAALLITRSGELRLNNSSPVGVNLWPGSPVDNSTGILRLGDDGKLTFGGWDSFSYPTNTILPNQPVNGTVLYSAGRKYSFNGTHLAYNGSSGVDVYYVRGQILMMDEAGQVTEADNNKFQTADYGDRRLRRLSLDDDGNLRIYSFDSNSSSWAVVFQVVFELCSISGTCGENSICTYADDYNTTTCVCPPGYRERAGGAKTEGCALKTPIPIRIGNSKFLQLDYVNFSVGSNLSLQTTINAKNFSACESRCLHDPNCLGFGYKFDGKGYCTLVQRLLFGYWSPAIEAAMFLRVDISEPDQTNFTGMTNVLETTCPVQLILPQPPQESRSTARNIAIICSIFAAELISGVAFFWAFVKKYQKYRDMARTFGLELLPAGGPKRFSYMELKAATNNFSSTNIIGKGGFGDVYKGVLSDHRVVAVKCLKNVMGGDREFWAEVTIIARMHHLNLVRLWGFCAEKGQRILVYEYVTNGSLDKFLFRGSKLVHTEEGQEDHEKINTPEQKPVLDWGIRYRIALGVARAIAYLHEECLEWVLHCDIKPENILLGDDFCPKISDFGLSKLRKKEDLVSYSRMRGTRGYMAPEWVKSNQITAKADVYSFGMVLLEILTGSRNHEIQGSKMESENWYFPRWAFDKVYKEMNVEDILDAHIKHSYDSQAHFDMINRMVKTAIWCLQDQPEMRPSMGKVAKMLEGTVEVTEPNKPTIFFLGDD